MKYNCYMKKCIELAKLAQGQTSPNPLVGCVILDKNDKIIATGYHHKCGENHAERDALLKLKNNEAEGGTLIVNLEPCSHFGKTPPCTDIIIERKIKKVVIGMHDVNPIVDGIKKLTSAGIEVVDNVMENDCKKLNEVFIKNQLEHKTFVAIKTATTLDGKIATSTGDSKWITSENARNEGKNIRKMYDAILTSSSTVITDNPTMEHKTKIILDRTLKTDFNNANIYKQENIYVFYGENIKCNPSSFSDKINFIKAPEKNGKLDLAFIFNKLYELNIMSVLIEAGGKLCGNALEYADKVYHFIAPKITGDNSCVSAFDFREITKISKCLNFKFDECKTFGEDILLTYYKVS
jgi:diaminohydroxyphosphoribosylaminopyrimidine deaminase / 5-amino-6-(5-phosphoribosylamino)uracil reductase